MKTTKPKTKNAGPPHMEDPPDVWPVYSVGVAVLARLLRRTAMRVQQLASDGVTVRIGHGKYDLLRSLEQFNEWRDKKGKEPEPVVVVPGGTLSDEDSGRASDRYESARARLTKARADIAEAQAAIIKGTVHEATAIEAVWSDMIGAAKSKLLALPSTLAPKVHGQESIAHIRAEIEAAALDMLNELSEYDPSRITKRYVETHSEPVDTAAPLDGEPVGGRDSEA